MSKLFLILILSLTGASAASQAVQKARRRPMQKSAAVLESPKQYLMRPAGRDEKTGEPRSYDPKPRVVPIDPKSGRYALKWIGYDGKEKVVEYQRADAIDAVVSASVSRTPEGRYLYTYVVKNLPSSPTFLSSFTVQNFAADTRPVEVNGKPTNDRDVGLLAAFRGAARGGQPRNFEGLHFGEMSNQIWEFREGNWIRVAILSDSGPAVGPGLGIEVKMLSSAPPGLVGCRVTAGDLTLKGAGEHMPTELEDAMPGYEEWPRGYTVGPVGNLASLSTKQRAEYLLERLPEFEQAGWMTPAARAWYGERLKQGDLGAVLRRAGRDLRSEQITTEVYGILQAAAERR